MITKRYISDFFYEENVEKSVNRAIESYNFSQHLGLGKLWVGFSGGKDSVCVYGVCKLAAQKLNMDVLDMCEFHYNVTGIDHPDLVYFMKREFPFVIRDMYTKSIWQLMEEKMFYPTRLMRFCCAELKEKGGNGRYCLMGVRRAESRNRASRGEYESIGKTRAEGKVFDIDNTEDRREMEHCIPKNKYICNPIIDWSDDMVWEFIDKENLPYCKLYDEGWKRLGCLFCPMATKAEKERMMKEYPKFKAQFVREFDKIIILRKEKGLKCTWKDGEDMFKQWQSK